MLSLKLLASRLPVGPAGQILFFCVSAAVQGTLQYMASRQTANHRAHADDFDIHMSARRRPSDPS
jgi:hypothetical protein